MDLLERYLQAVGEHLPASDEGRHTGGAAGESCSGDGGPRRGAGAIADRGRGGQVLGEARMPVLVAARYLPQQYLIGPRGFLSTGSR